ELAWKGNPGRGLISIPASGGFPFRPVARVLAWAGDRVDVVAADRRVGPLPPRSQGFFGRLRRDQGVTAGADQVLPSGLLQSLAHLEVILRLEQLHQRSLQLAVAQIAGDEDLLAGERVDASVVHARRDVTGHLHKIRISGAHISGMRPPTATDLASSLPRRSTNANFLLATVKKARRCVGPKR